ncbi:MAG: DUF975 family protein [Myxococcota bacterium]|jgi:uncharacterized membrane protein|nr:DUF975 family protein [Myxococcota bacterium]
MTEADLSISSLLSEAWETFQRRPGIAIAMWLVFFFFDSGGAGGGDEASLIESLLALVVLLVSGPIQGGYDYAMLRLLRGDDTVTFSDVFAGFQKFERLFLVFLIYMVAVVVGIVLLIVPGVIIALGLWPAFLLVMEDDDVGAIEALRGAWDLTNGYKGQLFVLAIVSIGLHLAGFIALGVGILIAGPVAQLAWISAYDELRSSEADGAQFAANALP